MSEHPSVIERRRQAYLLLEDALDSLEYIERNHPGLSGYGVRQTRIEALRKHLGIPTLKACPFCGGRAALHETGGAGRFEVICDSCAARTSNWNNQEGALRDWDRRVSDGPIPNTTNECVHIWRYPLKPSASPGKPENSIKPRSS